MKGKYLVVALLIAVLAIGSLGCNKVTGGGQFTDEWTGNKVTFGFNAQPIASEDSVFTGAKGQFQLIDHDAKTNIHGTFDTGYNAPSFDPEDPTLPPTSWFSGTCSIDGEGEYYFEVTATDNGNSSLGVGDYILIMAGPYTYQGYLESGNIQVHKANKK